jgi:hypothetical protein
MTQLFTMGLDPGGFRALTLIGYVLDGEVDFTSRFDIWGWLCRIVAEALVRDIGCTRTRIDGGDVEGSA